MPCIAVFFDSNQGLPGSNDGDANVNPKGAIFDMDRGAVRIELDAFPERWRAVKLEARLFPSAVAWVKAHSGYPFPSTSSIKN